MKQVWFVTGASLGLGKALVQRLLAAGYCVAAASRKAAVSDHENLLPLTVDITSEDSVRNAIAQTVAHFGHLDVVVNNAGYSIYGAVEVLSDKEFRDTINVNVFGTVNVIRMAMPYLRQQRSGHIINISSVAGYKGYGNSPSYAAGKFAVIGLSEALAEEVKPFGVRVTVVAPGFFRTDFLNKGEAQVAKQKVEGYETDALLERLQAMNGKQPGDPGKLADALIYITTIPQPPLHLLMGPDAYQIVTQKKTAELAEFEKWKELTVGTNFPKVNDQPGF